MSTPGNDTSKAAMLCFQRSQIANTAFIQSSTIIDHQQSPALREIHRLKKDIDASVMPHRKRPPSQALPLITGPIPCAAMRKSN